MFLVMKTMPSFYKLEYHWAKAISCWRDLRSAIVCLFVTIEVVVGTDFGGLLPNF